MAGAVLAVSETADDVVLLFWQPAAQSTFPVDYCCPQVTVETRAFARGSRASNRLEGTAESGALPLTPDQQRVSRATAPTTLELTPGSLAADPQHEHNTLTPSAQQAELRGSRAEGAGLPGRLPQAGRPPEGA